MIDKAPERLPFEEALTASGSTTAENTGKMVTLLGDIQTRTPQGTDRLIAAVHEGTSATRGVGDEVAASGSRESALQKAITTLATQENAQRQAQIMNPLAGGGPISDDMQRIMSGKPSVALESLMKEQAAQEKKSQKDTQDALTKADMGAMGIGDFSQWLKEATEQEIAALWENSNQTGSTVTQAELDKMWEKPESLFDDVEVASKTGVGEKATPEEIAGLFGARPARTAGELAMESVGPLEDMQSSTGQDQIMNPVFSGTQVGAEQMGIRLTGQVVVTIDDAAFKAKIVNMVAESIGSASVQSSLKQAGYLRAT